MRKLIIITIIILAAAFPALAASKKYISLAPSTTEILFALGLEEEIVGVSSYCDYPLAARKKEKVGTFSSPSIEKILSLKPDYIFCTGLEQAQAVNQLRKLNLKVFVSDPQDFSQLYASIQEIGKITDKDGEAQALIRKMQEVNEEIAAKVKSIPEEKRANVFIEIWYDPLTTAGKNSFIDAIINAAGGKNIAYDTKRAYSIFSQEEVIQRNPDCIIITYMSKASPKKSVSQRPGWNRISAVKSGRIYSDIEPNLLLRPGPRSASGVKELYKRFYP
jgi:iron complex transport system substrate-binding protein